MDMTNRLKVYRAMYDLTQAQLAKIIGVTRGTILSIENGKYIPSLEIAFKLAIYFDVVIEEIFTYNWINGPKPVVKHDFPR